MDNRSFEADVKQRMEELKLTPSAPVWAGVDAALRKDKRRRWLFFLLFAGALLGTGTWVFYQINTSALSKQQVAVTEPVHPDLPADEMNNADNKNPEKLYSINQNKPSSSEKQVAETKTKTEVELIKKDGASSKIKNSKLLRYKPNSLQPKVTVRKTDRIPSVIISAKEADTSVVQTKTSEPEELKTDTVQAAPVFAIVPAVLNADSVLSKDSAAVLPALNQPSGQKVKTRKWQSGFQLNAGVTDIQQSLFPRANLFNSGLSSTTMVGVAGTNYPGIIVKDYTVNGGMQLGAGYVLRRKFSKRLSLTTGIQYQYNRFHVQVRERIDTFSLQANRFAVYSVQEEKEPYRFHYISIPLELQWNLLYLRQDRILLSAGVQNQFQVAAKPSVPTFVTADKAIRFQPLLTLAPAYAMITKPGELQIGFYFQYGLRNVYQSNYATNWWQGGLRLQYFLQQKK